MSPPRDAELAWKALGAPAPSALAPARLALHWAVQIPASIGYTFLEPEPDYGHLSLAWLDGAGLLASRLAPATPSFRAALRPSTLTLLLLDADDHPRRTFDLTGRTLDEGYAWLAEALRDFAGQAEPLTRPDHALPDHPVAHGARFDAAPEALEELARWYADAFAILQAISQAVPEASPVRCWPHHFDLATLLQFDPDAGVEAARSIGVGLSPGDGSYPEPYVYVLPWPPPDASLLPPLDAIGRWHTRGWIGATLPGSAIVDAGSAEAQAQRTQAFVDDAVAACRRVLGLPPA